MPPAWPSKPGMSVRTMRCGFSPATVGVSAWSNQSRARSSSASWRRCRGVLGSSSPGGIIRASRAVSRAWPARLVSQPSTRRIPPMVSERETPRRCSWVSDGDLPGPVDRLPPVFDRPGGVGHGETFDDVDQTLLGGWEDVGDGFGEFEQMSGLVGGQPTVSPGLEDDRCSLGSHTPNHHLLGVTSRHAGLMGQICGGGRVAELDMPSPVGQVLGPPGDDHLELPAAGCGLDYPSAHLLHRQLVGVDHRHLIEMSTYKPAVTDF